MDRRQVITDRLPLVKCPAPHKPYQLLARGPLVMSPTAGMPMPYGYYLWTYIHYTRKRKGGQITCGHQEKRLVKWTW